MNLRQKLMSRLLANTDRKARTMSSRSVAMLLLCTTAVIFALSLGSCLMWLHMCTLYNVLIVALQRINESTADRKAVTPECMLQCWRAVLGQSSTWLARCSWSQSMQHPICCAGWGCYILQVQCHIYWEEVECIEPDMAANADQHAR